MDNLIIEHEDDRRPTPKRSPLSPTIVTPSGHAESRTDRPLVDSTNSDLPIVHFDSLQSFL